VPATGTAVIFGKALAAEAQLDLHNYQGTAPTMHGMTHRVVGEGGVELIGFDGAFHGFVAEGVDARLKADDRIKAFRTLGGHFVIGTIDDEALDRLASKHDLTLVAAGKGGLSNLFPRDASQSSFETPQRSLVMLTVHGLGFDESVFAHRSPKGGKHAAFSFNAENGEAWWGPYLQKDAGPSWSFLWCARPGSEWEQRPGLSSQRQRAVRRCVLRPDFPSTALAECDDSRSGQGAGDGTCRLRGGGCAGTFG
jgi:hypothetical protein